METPKRIQAIALVFIGLLVAVSITFVVNCQKVGLATSFFPVVLTAYCILFLGALIATFVTGLRPQLIALATSCLLALVAWWFVPNWEGRSLFQARLDARRNLEELQAPRPLTQIRQVASGVGEREHLKVHFPLFEPGLHRAEVAWQDDALAALSKEIAGKPPAEKLGRLRFRGHEFRSFGMAHPVWRRFAVYSNQVMREQLAAAKTRTAELIRDEKFAELAPLTEEFEQIREGELMTEETAQDISLYCQAVRFVLEVELRSRGAKQTSTE